MGEPDSFYSSTPTFFVIMRNSRGKLFVYIAVLGVLCFIVFLLSSTHTSLKELEGVNEKCQQQRDSLSAQLQVVYEHKNRLEKSLQQEKTDHKHTKEANEKQLSDVEKQFLKEKDEKQKIESKLTQLKKSYSELEDDKTQSVNDLKQQLKSVQLQKEGEIKKLQAHISDLLSEKEKLETSNNAFTWKLEQHVKKSLSEINLCHLQLQQTKAELQTCQEQMKTHNADTNLIEQPLVTDKTSKAPQKIEQPHDQLVPQNENQVSPIKIPNLPGENEIVPLENQEFKVVQENAINITISPPLEKVSVLDKPRVMPANHNGEGVLPKPMSHKPDDQIKDLDAAAEVEESNKPVKDPLVNNIVDQYADRKNHLMHGYRKPNPALDTAPAGANLLQKEQENHPQVAPPNFENIEEKDDHAAERDVDGNMYNPDAKPQVEEPVLGGQNRPPKDLFPVNAQENNDIAAQMNDMMNKSPGNINNAQEQNVLNVPPHLEAQNPKNQNEFKNEVAFMHRGADAHRVMDDKNYEEDDDDRDNDDEPLNGLAPAMKGVHNVLQDNDFDDQENQDNADNAKEEEGVVVAPK